MTTALVVSVIICKIIISALMLDRFRLKKQIKSLKGSPVGYMCQTDWEYELDPCIKGSSCVVYNSLKSCKNKMGKKHYEECGIIEVSLVKNKIAIKGKF